MNALAMIRATIQRTVQKLRIERDRLTAEIQELEKMMPAHRPARKRARGGRKKSVTTLARRLLSRADQVTPKQFARVAGVTLKVAGKTLWNLKAAGEAKTPTRGVYVKTQMGVK